MTTMMDKPSPSGGSAPSNLRLAEDGIQVELTDEPIDVGAQYNAVRSPKAGAVVSFAGTTRDNFNGEPVKELMYHSYRSLAIRTMFDIAKSIKAEHSLVAIAIIHRLGVVPIGEESILISVSASHRQAAWRAGEATLELCKERVEIWKREEFYSRPGQWRENQEGRRPEGRTGPELGDGDKDGGGSGSGGGIRAGSPAQPDGGAATWADSRVRMHERAS